ncbi:hypothetical protein G5C51_04630 [Streptomyces sp. A7024]|uniref:Uncharacterized protein n=1 Tax=Streptomyces coryli TaxID=1128680 RepID=A0A6G4TTJ7_9ACTN|nr:hypothetical protein [Streptomyces coryli]NGN63194.1 hypothetical protein [Streptomyces coryli]
MTEHSPATRPAAADVFARLNADFAALCADGERAAAVSGWLDAAQLALPPAPAGGFGGTAGQLLAALQPTAPTSAAHKDDLLRMLLARAAGRGAHHTFAVRIVVQAMLPAAMTLAHRLAHAGRGSFQDLAGHAVSAVFEIAAIGRIHTRPGSCAANLALDTAKRLRRDLGHDSEPHAVARLSPDIPLVDTDPAVDPVWRAEAALLLGAARRHGLARTPVSAPEELRLLEVLIRAIESGLLTRPEALAISSRYGPDPVSDAAQSTRAGTATGAVRMRRMRAVKRLAAAAARLTTAA